MVKIKLRMPYRVITTSIRTLIRRKYLIFIILIFASIYFNIFDNDDVDNVEYNYFEEVDSRRNVGFLLKTPSCTILNLSVWDPSIAPLMRKLPQVFCDKQNRHWSYVDDSYLEINRSAIIESGFSFDSISCCYRSFHRENDNEISFSNECHQITDVSTLMAIFATEYIKVTCIGKYWPYQSEILYKNYHIFALGDKDYKTQKKVNFWTLSDLIKPPSVLIIGIDSVSRSSSIRHLPKTRNILEKIGGIEFQSYVKVGENTFPNLLPLLTGYSQEDLVKICLLDKLKSMDKCPFIWHDFDKARYYTGDIEDVPKLSTFNYLRSGFFQQPTDFNYRPFNIGIGIPFFPPNDLYNCIGYDKSEKIMLKYVEDLTKMSEKVGVPLYLRSWDIHLAHDDYSGVQQGDEEFADFFSRLKLNNTLLIFLSDHGYRYGKIRNTFAGWNEDKLPMFWFILSEDLKKKYPNWVQNLQINSRRLTSPFDVYQTMVEILKMTNSQPSDATANGQPFPRKFGQSLISEEISPLRKCKDAGISSFYCPCSIPQSIPLHNSMLKKGALHAVQHINSILPANICSKLSLKSLYSGAFLESVESTYSTYIVGFEVSPGSYRFEANVDFFNGNFTVTTSKIFRTSKMTFTRICMDDAVLELFCYCLSD